MTDFGDRELEPDTSHYEERMEMAERADELAADLAALRAENARLREALERIAENASGRPGNTGWAAFGRIAHAALSPTEAPTDDAR